MSKRIKINKKPSKVFLSREAAQFKGLFSPKYEKWLVTELSLLAANNWTFSSVEEANANIDKAIKELSKTLQAAIEPEITRLIADEREDILKDLSENVVAGPNLPQMGPSTPAPAPTTEAVPAAAPAPVAEPTTMAPPPASKQRKQLAMTKCNTEETAKKIAEREGLSYGVSVFDGKFYVGTEEELKGVGVDQQPASKLSKVIKALSANASLTLNEAPVAPKKASLFYNTKEEFGKPGPFEAISKEELADEMLPTLNAWAEEEWSDLMQQGIDSVVLGDRDKKSYIEESVGAMYVDFIDGLEEVGNRQGRKADKFDQDLAESKKNIDKALRDPLDQPKPNIAPRKGSVGPKTLSEFNTTEDEYYQLVNAVLELQETDAVMYDGVMEALYMKDPEKIATRDDIDVALSGINRQMFDQLKTDLWIGSEYTAKKAALELRPVGSNMTEVETDTVVVLFSYSTPVAYMDKTSGQCFRTSEKFSTTTSRHINKWLEGRPAEEVDQAQIEGLVQTANTELFSIEAVESLDKEQAEKILSKIVGEAVDLADFKEIVLEEQELEAKLETKDDMSQHTQVRLKEAQAFPSEDLPDLDATEITFERYGPGKYDNNLDAWLDAITLEGFSDDQLGDAENFGHYSLVLFDTPVTVIDHTRSTLAEDAQERQLSGAIVGTNAQGFVAADTFDTVDQARQVWEQLQEEYAQFLGESEGEGEEDVFRGS